MLVGFLVLCACWSTTWYAIRLCLTGYPPLLGAGLRFLLATVLLGGISLLWRRACTFPRGSGRHGALALSGLANGLGYACVYLAERTISGGTAAVIAASSPFFTALVARLFGLEPLVARRLLGVLIGFAGVTLMMADGWEQGTGHVGAMLLVVVASAVLWPLYGALLKRHAHTFNPLAGCTFFLGYTALTLLLLSLLGGERLPPLVQVPLVAHLGLFYLVIVGSVIAWTVYLWLLQRLDLTLLATMALIQPVLALGVDWLARDTQLRPEGYLGALLVLAGVGLAALKLPRAHTGPQSALASSVAAAGCSEEVART
ncbi:MAG: EamA family transporter [Myxococcales bacterium]|nr:EamA family transporter [Myxococcota bacterium]MDW8281126.1 EamA family transporter [Myxococcales bacterium]